MKPKYGPGTLINYHHDRVYKIVAICNLPTRFMENKSEVPPLVYLLNMLDEKYESIGQVYHPIELVDRESTPVIGAIQVLYGGL